LILTDEVFCGRSVAGIARLQIVADLFPQRGLIFQLAFGFLYL